MGHYYSEMGFEERDRLEAETHKNNMLALASRVEKAIEKEGLPMVLAKIIQGSKNFGLNSPPEFWEYRDETE